MATAPTPVSVDELAGQYLQLKKTADDLAQAAAEAQKPLQEKAQELRDLVRECGSAHAEKAKLLHGISYEIMCSFGQSVTVDGTAVENFRLALVQAKQARVLRKVFEKTIRWTLAPQASAIIRGMELPKKLSALYAACSVVRDQTPRLTVRPKNA
ncbi:MAG: hypothetical protein ACRD20_18235 [Terriglobales bacterium]